MSRQTSRSLKMERAETSVLNHFMPRNNLDDGRIRKVY
jgi:hypothetical protein